MSQSHPIPMSQSHPISQICPSEERNITEGKEQLADVALSCQNFNEFEDEKLDDDLQESSSADNQYINLGCGYPGGEMTVGSW